MIGVYPGSFDPMTCGHLDIVQRASKCCDKLYVAVFENTGKEPMFSLKERMQLAEEAAKDIPNVFVASSKGLLVNFVKDVGAHVIVRGLRAVSDFDYEFKMALMNKKLDPEIETIFMITELNYLYLDSSLVKEIASYGGSIKGLVPPPIEDKLMKRVEELRRR